MLMVFEMAPVMNGCAAAIIRMWLSTERQRVPLGPHGLAQSKTGRCSDFRCDAPSRVIAPQHQVLAASISAREKPSAVNRSKLGSASAAGATPRRSVQKASPRVHLLKANLMSKAAARAA